MAPAPPPPLPVTEDTPPDMLAGSMDLLVSLPSGRTVKMSAERCTPMMDLLVQITTANKMAPGGFVLQPVGERGVLPYKPSTPIGALDTWTIQIVPKARMNSTSGLKKAPLKPNNQQPFEQTFRLQVHLPRNQLFVTRVSPKSLLSDVLNLACSEKNLDPNKYELRHPANLEERLRPELTLADYRLQEVTLVAKGNRPLGSGLSSSDIMALQKEEEKRRQQVRANGGSAVLGLMLGKNSQSSGCEGSISSDSLGGRSISPTRSDETPSPPGSSLPPPRPVRKRRPAPKPPTQAPPPQQPPAAVISHSRNSSDSSGYHEASILSESPESNGLSSPSGTLPRRSKLTNGTAQPTNGTTSHNLSRSLSNLAHSSNGEHKPVPLNSFLHKNGHSVSTTSLASSGHGKKKKVAPPPPPVASAGPTLVKSTLHGQLLPEQRTASLSTLSSQSSGDSFDRELYSRSATLERPSSSQSSTTSNNARQESLPEETCLEEEEYQSPSLQRDLIQNVSNDITQEIHEEPKRTHLEKKFDKVHLQPAESQEIHHPLHQNLSVTHDPHHYPPHLVEEVPISLKPEMQIRSASRDLRANVSAFTYESIAPVNNEVQNDDAAPTTTTKIVAPSRASAPDVATGKKKFPTPKPRVLPVESPKDIPPTPRPRARQRLEVEKCVKRSESPILLSDSVEKDSAFDSDGTRCNSPNSSDIVKSHGKFGGTFGVGKTMVMLAASARDSISSESYRDTKSIDSLNSDVEMRTRFGTDNDYDDDDGLNISENDLEMFENKSDKIDSPPIEVPAQDTASLFDSISMASSVFDSEHETSDGTWDKYSVGSREFVRNQLGIRNSLQQSSVKETSKLRASSLCSMEEVPSFLEQECQLGRWPSTEDLHAKGKNQRTELEKEKDDIQQEFESVTKELQAVILAEEENQAAPESVLPNPKTDSPSPSLVDWEYHLPAPPSAFRDSQSPTLTRETENSSDIAVTDETTPEVLPPVEFIDNIKPSQDNETNSLASLIIEKECPLIQNLVKGVTKVNPLFSEEKYEAEILDETETHDKEKLSPIVRNNEREIENEEDWSPQLLTEDVSPTEGLKDQNKLLHQSSTSYENHQVNPLKNFTISTYQSSREIDLLFKGENAPPKQSEFKKNIETSIYKRKDSNHSTGSNLPRNNSFSAKNNLQNERGPVKRSTSHVSLKNSGRTFRAKSIGNLSLETSREGYGLESTESMIHERHEGLRKTTSEANINQDFGKSSRLAELQDQFLQWQEQLLRQTQPDIPPQSLQVLRSILSPSQEGFREKSTENPVVIIRDNISAKSRNTEDSEPLEAPVPPRLETPLQRQSSSADNSNKQYSYQGPPAVNFSTWSERPKSQVSIKIDNDYRIGKGQNSSVSHKVDNEMIVKEKKTAEDQVDSRANNVVLSRSESMSHVNGRAKVEPTALTMRIISHSTPSGYKKTSPTAPVSSNTSIKLQDLSQNVEKEAPTSHPVVMRVHSYNTAQMTDPSRVPIVRAVELKKTFSHGQQNAILPDKKQSNSSVKLSWDEEHNPGLSNGNKSGNKYNNTNNDYTDSEETFQGVNNLAKRFSLAASNSENIKTVRPSTRPVSAYLYNESKTIIADTKKVIPNVSNAKELNSVNHGHHNVKKYTSVVGINGVHPAGSNKEPLQDVVRPAPKVVAVSTAQKGISNSVSKPPVMLNARHPMPVVKGFRFATNDYSDTSLVSADSYKVPQNSHQSVMVKVQQNNSVHNSNQRNSVVIESPSVINVRTQPGLVSKHSAVPPNGNQQIPIPPSAPALPKKIQPLRPKSFPAPEANPRDQLMDAIRNFGGRGKLRQTSAS